MTVGAVAGTKVYIGTAEAVASPDDWKEIGNVYNIGEVGSQFNKIAVEAIGDGYTRQIKGTQLAPAFPLVLNRDDADLGQIALKAANADRNSFYNFRLVENDMPTGGVSGTQSIFKARVYGFSAAYGGVNDLKRINSSLEIEPDSIVIIAAF